MVLGRGLFEMVVIIFVLIGQLKRSVIVVFECLQLDFLGHKFLSYALAANLGVLTLSACLITTYPQSTLYSLALCTGLISLIQFGLFIYKILIIMPS